MARLLSNLDLNGTTSPRAQPRIGAWGPELVPTTRWKKWQRVLAWVAFVLALAACVGWGWYVYDMMTKSS